MKLQLRIICILFAFMVLFNVGGCTGSPTEQDILVSISEQMEMSELSDEENSGEYRVLYFPDVNSTVPSEMITVAVSGEKTKILTIKELGFSKDGFVFEGWRINRDTDNKWFLRAPDNNCSWNSLDNDELPNGYHFALREDGGKLISPASEGEIHLYAQWGGKSFNVVYHNDENSEAADQTTVVTYGESTPMLTLEELGFEKEGAEFKGWKLYRDIDGKWRVKDANGNSAWVKLDDGKIPEGYTIVYFKDGHKISSAATSGTVHAYAVWS